MRHEALTYDDMPTKPGLMDDLAKVAECAAHVADRAEQLRARLDPILPPDLVTPAFVADDVPGLSPAQQRLHAVAVTLQSIDETIAHLLDGIRL